MNNHHHCNHGSNSFSKPLLVGIALNLLFIAIEIIYGIKADSLALLSDAAHNSSDVLGLALTLGAVQLAKRKPTGRFTYGFGSASIYSGLANSTLLLVAVGALGWEAITRLSSPEPVGGREVIVVALIGVVINGLTAAMLHKGSHHDLNRRAAFMHMAADAAISLGVAASGIIIISTGWLWVDPVVSLVVSLVIIVGTWGLLKESANLALHASPKDINPSEVKEFLLSHSDVSAIHDLHIWAMSASEAALSAHIVVSGKHPGDAFLKTLSKNLEIKFNIGHSTIQIEIGDTDTLCELAEGHK